MVSVVYIRFDIVIKKNENNTAAPVDHVDEIVRMVS